MDVDWTSERRCSTMANGAGRFWQPRYRCVHRCIYYSSATRESRTEEEESAQIASRYLSFTTTETWRATRVRATQLVPENLLQSLVEYYSPLEALLIMLRAKGPGTDAGEMWFRLVLQRALGDEKVAVPPTVKQAKEMLKAQDKAQKKIADYLRTT